MTKTYSTYVAAAADSVELNARGYGLSVSSGFKGLKYTVTVSGPSEAVESVLNTRPSYGKVK